VAPSAVDRSAPPAPDEDGGLVSICFLRTLAESSISSQADHRDRAAEPHHSDNGSPRDLHEDARDVARALASTPEYVEACRRRKKVEMLFAHLKRILRLDRLRLGGPNGARDEFLLAATAQNLRKLAKLIPVPGPIFAT
jgi:hypothetical protein